MSDLFISHTSVITECLQATVWHQAWHWSAEFDKSLYFFELGVVFIPNQLEKNGFTRSHSSSHVSETLKTYFRIHKFTPRKRLFAHTLSLNSSTAPKGCLLNVRGQSVALGALEISRKRANSEQVSKHGACNMFSSCEKHEGSYLEAYIFMLFPSTVWNIVLVSMLAPFGKRFSSMFGSFWD